MNKRNILLVGGVVIVLVAAVALVAMAFSGASPEPQSFTAADDGATIEVAVGESFSVVLEGNPTTGYSWQVEGVDEGVLTASEPEYVGEATDLVGAGGTYTFTFTAAGPGTAQVRLVYLRPWEQVDPIDTFTLTVHTH